VLVTDHLMPGLTGLELVRLTAERFPNVVCVIASGCPAPPEATGIVWVRKPLDVHAHLTALLVRDSEAA